MASFSVSYGWTKYDYGDAEYLGTILARMLDREEQAINLAAYLQPGARTRLSLGGHWGMFELTGGASLISGAQA